MGANRFLKLWGLKLDSLFFKNYFFPFVVGRTRTQEKYRSVYTEEQLLYLESQFTDHKFLTPRKKMKFANDTSLSERQVKFWYQNRRAKGKKIQNRQGASL